MLHTSPLAARRRFPAAMPFAGIPALPEGRAGFAHEDIARLGPRPSSSPSVGAPVSLAGRRVLLVEDELLLALDLQMALEDEGAAVVGPVDDLDEGLDLLDREAIFDAAILDIDLHGKDVFPLAERLRRRDVPFVFHTGHGERAALARHFDDAPVCIKPVLNETLLAILKGLLR